MEQNKLTLGSLFDGSGGFPLGGLLSGITPVWASEIEPFPIRVTTKRLPQMKHYGDVSLMDGGEVEPVDIITFGSPCQDMSIAGKREGLGGNRSGLFYQAVRIIKEMREKTNGKYPRYIVWENVPGAFSSNKGEDFRCVLESICHIADETVSVPSVKKWQYAGEIVGDGYSVAWRLLDAQYWGVPQRRKRVYLVADFTGGCAGKILFESEGLSGYTPQGFRSWQGTAGHSPEGSGEAGTVCLNAQGGDRMDVSEDVTGTLRAQDHWHPLVVVETPKTLKIRSGCEGGMAVVALEGTGTRPSHKGSGYSEKGVSFTLNATEQHAVAYGIDRMDVSEDVTGTLRAEAHHPPCVMESAGFRTEHSAKSRSIGYEEEISPTLCAGVVPATVYENHGQDCRYTGPIDTAPTVSATYGTGGNNQPFVVETPKTLKIRSGCEGGGKGALIQDDKSATLGTHNDQTVFVPFVKGTRPHSAEEGQQWKESDVANTLNTHDVGEARCNELAVLATDHKDPPLINDKDEAEYIVRRLTPTECARLQGFPDWWCDGLGTENPTEEEIAFWRDVFETHRKVITGAKKPKTRAQIVKWLKSPHSDSAEYKMWGNGVALPCVHFVLAGIVYYSQFTLSDREKEIVDGLNQGAN